MPLFYSITITSPLILSSPLLKTLSFLPSLPIDLYTDASSFYIAFVKKSVGDFCTADSCMGELAQTHFIIFRKYFLWLVCTCCSAIAAVL